MHPEIITLPYLNNIESTLVNLEHLEHLVLFDSMKGTHKDGQWTILVGQPIQTLEIKEHEEANSATKAQLIELSQRLKLPSDFDNQNLPFLGGVAGFISYDNGILEKGITTPVRQSEELSKLFVGLFTWAFLWDHKNKKSYLVYWQNESTPSSSTLIEKYNTTNTTSHDFDLTSGFRPHWTRDQYKKAYTRIIDYIHSGDIYQINLAQSYSSNYTGSPLAAYFRLRAKAEAPFSTFWKTKDTYLLSASPERFIACKNRNIETRPIKGTKPRHQCSDKDNNSKIELKQDLKERSENLMIVDLLRNDISKHAHNIKVPKLFEVETYPTVHHLVSTITGSLNKESNPIDLLWDAFPGGSITGTPKKRAINIIDELEDGPRGFYCGTSFYVSADGNMDSNILIRTFMLRNSHIQCWAGGGIVADSKLENEYNECEDKMGKLKDWISK